eukprot:TRINITY_DN18716_c0_g1_i1.p1 TRINITY_DN18716_c0_g1~~TRINITY_DN18716_c0_g1_i1.p1  ORF type:complete len:1646 (+),score=510.58 TRINITY_DN18716_c0_g1_i1:41-4939(+)
MPGDGDDAPPRRSSAWPGATLLTRWKEDVKKMGNGVAAEEPTVFESDDEEDIPFIEGEIAQGYFYNTCSKSLCCMSADCGLRHFVWRRIVSTEWMEVAVLVAIICNSVTLAMDIPATRDDAEVQDFLNAAECGFQLFFTVEVVVKVVALGFACHRGAYLRSGWHVLDLLVVMGGFVSGTCVAVVLRDSGVNLSVVRLLRVLRPLRAVQRVKGLRVMVSALFMSIPGVRDAFLLLCFFVAVGAVLGVELFSGVLSQRCYYQTADAVPKLVANDTDEPCSRMEGFGRQCASNGVTLAQTCEVRQDQYHHKVINFDSFPNAALLIFRVVSLDDWPWLSHLTQEGTSGAASLFYMCIVFFGSLFCVNLFLVVVSQQYINALVVEPQDAVTGSDDDVASRRVTRCTEQSQDSPARKLQIRLPVMFASLATATSTHVPCLPRARAFVCDHFCDSTTRLGAAFHNFMMLVTLFNVAILAVHHHDEPQDLTDFTDRANFVCTGVFMVEFLIKAFGLGLRRYFFDYVHRWAAGREEHVWSLNWYNATDFTLVVISIPDFAATSGSAFSVFRVFRVARMVRVVVRWHRLRMLVAAVAQSARGCAHLLLLLMLLIFVFGILGLQLFEGVGKKDASGRTQMRINFDSLWEALVAAFIVITGDSWTYVMVDTMVGSGWTVSCVYFLALFVIGNYMFINLFVAVLLDKFCHADNDSCLPPSVFHVVSTLSAAKLPDKCTIATLEQVQTIVPLLDIADDQCCRIEPFPCVVMGPRAEEGQPSNRLGYDETDQEFVLVCNSGGADIDDYVDPIARRYAVGRGTAASLGQRDRVSFVRSFSTFGSRTRSASVWSISHSIFERKWIVEEDTISRSLAVPCHPVLPDAEKEADRMGLTGPLPRNNPLRQTMARTVLHPVFEAVVMAVIGGNATLLFIRKSLSDTLQEQLQVFFATLFAVELLLKLLALGPARHLASVGDRVDGLVVLVTLLFLAWSPLYAVSSLRVIRLACYAEPVRLLFKALAHAVAAVGYVLIAGLFVLLLFGVLGVYFFRGYSQYCNDPAVERLADCVGFFNGTSLLHDGTEVNMTLPRSRGTYKENFDHLPQAMYTLFQVSTGDSWSAVMFGIIDSRGVELTPRRSSHPGRALFFVAFVVTGSFFWLNLFVSILTALTTQSKDAEMEAQLAVATDQERAWVDAQKFMAHWQLKPAPRPPKGRLRRSAFALVTHGAFDLLISAVVILNILTMCMQHRGQPASLGTFLEISNLVFVAIFVVEAALKVLGLGPRVYLADTWNRLDLLLVVLSLSQLVFRQNGIAVLRIFRVGRLFRLSRRWRNLHKLFTTLLWALPALVYTLMLAVATFFVFAVIGRELFGHVKSVGGAGLTSSSHFHNVPVAMLTLFEAATTVRWRNIRDGCMITPENSDCTREEGNCGADEWVVHLYFFVFMLVGSFTMLNLFVAIVMDQFPPEDAAQRRLLQLAQSAGKTLWNAVDKDATGRLSLPQTVIMLRVLILNPQWNARLCCVTEGAVTVSMSSVYSVFKRLPLPITAGTYVRYGDWLQALSKLLWAIGDDRAMSLHHIPGVPEQYSSHEYYLAHHLHATIKLQRSWRNCRGVFANSSRARQTAVPDAVAMGDAASIFAALRKCRDDSASSL